MGTGISPTFTTLAEAWAKIEPVGTAIFFGSKQVGESVTHRITLRRSAAVTEGTVTGEHVVESGGLRYRVKRATPLNGKKVWLMLEVEELGSV